MCKKTFVLIIVTSILFSCSRQLYFNYNPNSYIESLINQIESKTFFTVEDIPETILKELQKSAEINFVLANPNDQYSTSSNIIGENIAYRKLIFYKKTIEGVNIICYEVKGYEKRAIISKLVKGKVKGAFDILFESDNVNDSNYINHLKDGNYKIVSIYN